MSKSESSCDFWAEFFINMSSKEFDDHVEYVKTNAPLNLWNNSERWRMRHLEHLELFTDARKLLANAGIKESCSSIVDCMIHLKDLERKLRDI